MNGLQCLAAGAVLCASVLAYGCQTVAQNSAGGPEFFPIPGEAGSRLPFSDAVRVGDLLFLSGKIGIQPGTMQLVPGGIKAETRQIMESIAASLARYGATMDDIVKCTIFLADIGEWGQMNEVYAQFFPNHKPARSALGASGLALGARAEIECIAAL